MTLTLSQLQALSDSELIANVARRVMNWTKDDYGPHFTWRYEGEYSASHLWNPLTEWGHTMQVVGKMESDNWQFWLSTFHSDVSKAGISKAIFGKTASLSDDVLYEDNDKQRAVCIAALLAVSQ